MHSSSGHSNLSPRVSVSRITGLASPFAMVEPRICYPHNYAYALHYTSTRISGICLQLLMYAMHSQSSSSSLVFCRFVPFVFSWCLLFPSSITLQFTFSWPLRGQFSISLGSVFKVPLPPYPFQSNFRLAGTIFVSHFCSGAFPSLLFSS